MQWRDIQNSFFDRMGTTQQIRLLFEHLPDLSFFLKDEESRMIAVSAGVLSRFGVKDESEVVGKTDYDFFHREVAENFVRDDRRVLQSGQPIIDRIEVWYNERRVLDWFVTTKLPVRDAAGRIIGIMGTIQSYEAKRKEMAPFSSVSKVVELIRRSHDRNVSSEEMAREAGLSIRQLNRRFRDTFGMTPHEFALKTRLQAASEALAQTDEPISDIALDFGFCDQSAFTVAFRKVMGMTPHKYRRSYEKSGSFVEAAPGGGG